MAENATSMRFDVDISRIIGILAEQIYPSPYALLRENVQNAYDAILQRSYQGDDFEPSIEIEISPNEIRISDNGLGMSESDLRQNFWRAGSSSKNTKEAQAAGVVGTFGIGAMANFGIAETLTVETQKAGSVERICSQAKRSTLSIKEDCISLDSVDPKPEPGTIIKAEMQDGQTIDVDKARNYIDDFVAFLKIRVTVNGDLVSQKPLSSAVSPLQPNWQSSDRIDFGNGISADVGITGAINGEVRLELKNFVFGSEKTPGLMVLRQSLGAIQTFRNGFGLATTATKSAYQLGGVADFLFLKPTAGREALNTDSVELLQRLIHRLDIYISEKLGQRPESNSNILFIDWASQHNRFDLCTNLLVSVVPGDQIRLGDVQTDPGNVKYLVYGGSDQSVKNLASKEKPMICLAARATRRRCEIEFLRKYCKDKFDEMDDTPKIVSRKRKGDWSFDDSTIAFRLREVLKQQYFLDTVVEYGEMTHGLPLLVVQHDGGVILTIDQKSESFALLASMLKEDYGAFNHMMTDYARTMIFPKIRDFVPSATRVGGDAFLKHVQRTRELFEYELDEVEDFTTLFADYLSGGVDAETALKRVGREVRRSQQTIDANSAGSVREVVPDLENESQSQEPQPPNFDAMPPIQRLDVATSKALLLIEPNDPALKGYRCFIALTNRAREENGEFFLQPHKTAIVWGGQRVLFIFEHISGQFGLYYDLQTRELASDVPGSGTFQTCTIVMKNRIFIPIPGQLDPIFVPKEGEKKKFMVRCDVLQIERNGEARPLEEKS